MVDPYKKKGETRFLLVAYALLFVVAAIFTVYLINVIDASSTPFQVLNIDSYITQAIEYMKGLQIPKMSWRIADIILIEFAVVSFVVFYHMTSRKNFMTGKEHGTASWGEKADRKQIIHPHFFENVIFTNTERMSRHDQNIKKNLNTLVIGGAGTGKSRFFVKPNLLQSNTSFVITDPKAELLRDTGHFLKEQGYTVKVFNLIDPAKSSKYNPFAYIRKESDVLKLIHNLMKNTTPPNQSGGDPFWEKAEMALLQAIFFYIYYELHVDEHHLKTVFKLLRMVEVREENEAFKSDFDELFELVREKDPDHIAVKQYDIFKMAAGKTAKSILVSAGVRLAPFSISDIETLLSKDELQLHTLGDEKTALFIVIPDSDSTFNFLVAMMYSQLFDSLYYAADFENGGRLKHHVRFLLDEFPNIGRIPGFSEIIATIRSRNMSASVIIQNMSQLKSMYKDHWETIVANCDSILYLGGKESSTHEWVNKSLGKMTIDTKNSSRSFGRSSSTSINHNTQGRELMTVDEIGRMPNEFCILFVRGLNPFYSKKFELEKHPNYKGLYEANKNDDLCLKSSVDDLFEYQTRNLDESLDTFDINELNDSVYQIDVILDKNERGAINHEKTDGG